jgi:hypothetical protein
VLSLLSSRITLNSYFCSLSKLLNNFNKFCKFERITFAHSKLLNNFNKSSTFERMLNTYLDTKTSRLQSRSGLSMACQQYLAVWPRDLSLSLGYLWLANIILLFGHQIGKSSMDKRKHTKTHNRLRTYLKEGPKLS